MRIEKEKNLKVARTLEGGYVYKGIEFQPFGKSYKVLFPERLVIVKDQIDARKVIDKYESERNGGVRPQGKRRPRMVR